MSESSQAVAQSSSWTSFIKSIASFNGDLSSLTAPPFILSSTSLCEFSQYWGEHPDLLVAASKINEDSIDSSATGASFTSDPTLLRVIAVTKYFISTLRSQYCSRNESMGSEKKPLNPFLGEVFVGKWISSDPTLGETILLSEQVSHHPPVTAYSIVNDTNNVLLEGYNGVRATISTTSINVKQYGHAILEYKDLNESFLITLPPLHIEGLINALPFVELDGTAYIQASNGYFVTVDFSGRGYFSGKKHTYKARIYRDQVSSASKENALVTIGGQWLEKSYITPGSSSPSSKADELFYDAMAVTPQHLTVKPIEEQHELESRRAWRTVAEAIKTSDYDKIHIEKSLIENAQRDLRKQEEESGARWETRWFDYVDYEKDIGPDPFVNLTNLSSLSIKNAPSGSLKNSKYDVGEAKHWRVNLDKWKAETEIKI